MIKLKSLLSETLEQKGIFIISTSKLLKESKGMFDLAIVQKVGGTDITQDSVDKIGSMKEAPLTSGGKNTYDPNKKEWTYSDLKSALGKEGQLIITTAGSVTKVRSQYGERICQLSKTVNQNSERHLGRTLTLLRLLQMGVDIKPKVAPGIGYETMQVDNLDSWVKENLGQGAKPLPLFVNGKASGVKVNGGAKISGVPKSDLGFGIDGNPNFFISYKHGAMFDTSGNEMKASFQQYGSISSFFNKQFTKQMNQQPGIMKEIDSFVEAVKRQVSKTGQVYNDVIDVVKEGKLWKLKTKKGVVIPKDQNPQIWAKNRAKIRKTKPKKLYVLEGSGAKGWSKRRSVLKMGKVGKDIAMMSIFGNDYSSGKAGINNCNILMQDNVAFKIGKKVDQDGSAIGIDMSVSSAGHIMWNPKIYGTTAKFPSFGKQYEPYFVARYTGESSMKTTDGLMIGVRLLINPASQTKGGDI